MSYNWALIACVLGRIAIQSKVHSKPFSVNAGFSNGGASVAAKSGTSDGQASASGQAQAQADLLPTQPPTQIMYLPPGHDLHYLIYDLRKRSRGRPPLLHGPYSYDTGYPAMGAAPVVNAAPSFDINLNFDIPDPTPITAPNIEPAPSKLCLLGENTFIICPTGKEHWSFLADKVLAEKHNLSVSHFRALEGD